MLPGIDVLRCHRDPPIVGLHVIASRDAIKITTVSEAAPSRVDLRKVLIITPVPRFDQWQNACSVRARLGAEDAGSRSPLISVSSKIILHVLPDEVQVIRLIALGHQAD